MSGDIPVFTRV